VAVLVGLVSTTADSGSQPVPLRPGVCHAASTQVLPSTMVDCEVKVSGKLAPRWTWGVAVALAVAVSATALLVQALVAGGTVALAEAMGDGSIASVDADGSGETAGTDSAVFGVPDAGAVDPHATQVEMTHARRQLNSRRILTLGPLRMTRPTPRAIDWPAPLWSTDRGRRAPPAVGGQAAARTNRRTNRRS
jgi:hypothetical protein